MSASEGRSGFGRGEGEGHPEKSGACDCQSLTSILSPYQRGEARECPQRIQGKPADNEFSTFGVTQLRGLERETAQRGTPNLLERCAQLLQPLAKRFDCAFITYT